MSTEPKIVAATGSTAPLGRGKRGNLIEQAMGVAIEEASAEAKAIWEQTDIDQEEKQKRIQEIMNPDAIRERKMQARAKAKALHGALAAEATKTEEPKGE